MVERNIVFKCAVSMLLCICMLLCASCAPAPAAETSEATEASQPPTQPGEDNKIEEPDTSIGRHIRLTSNSNGTNSLLQYEFGGLTDATHQSSLLAWDSADPESASGKFSSDKDRFYFRNGYWGIEYTFDAKITGADMGVTMYQSFYGINDNYAAANQYGRYGNMLITNKGDIYSALITEKTEDPSQYWVGKIDTEKIDLSQWHTYTFRWVRTSQTSSSYYLWLYIDGEFIPYEGDNVVQTKNGGKTDYFAVKVHLSKGTVEVDNISAAQANFNHNGMPTTAAPDRTPADIAHDNSNGEPKTVLNDNFDDANLAGNWRIGLSSGNTIDIDKTYPDDRKS